jgi:hypothetical protein
MNKKALNPNCLLCKRKEGRYIFIDTQGDDVPLCKECYEGLPKDEKKSLMLDMGRSLLSNTSMLNPGLAFGLLGAAGYRRGEKYADRMLDGMAERYHISQEELDDYSIDKYNLHYDLCGSHKGGVAQRRGHTRLKKNQEKQPCVHSYNPKSST